MNGVSWLKMTILALPATTRVPRPGNGRPAIHPTTHPAISWTGRCRRGVPTTAAMSRGDAHEAKHRDGQQSLPGVLHAELQPPLSRSEAARRGGLTTLERHGREFYREIGRIGFAVTAERYGRDFAHERAAAARRAHPERASHDEQRMMKLLAGLDQGDLLAGEPVRYSREYKITSGIYVDFAWPSEQRALEVYGGIHQVLAFDVDGTRAVREAEREARIRAEGWQLLTVTDRDLTARQWAATSDRVAAFLDRAPGRWLRAWKEEGA
jgi:very-short-patch-repair endonuclease